MNPADFKGQSGIYRIYRIDGNPRECWVGQAGDFLRRWNIHLGAFARGTNSRILQRAWVKYGADSFGWEVIEIVSDRDKLDKREQHYLDTIRPIYNIAKVASSRRGVLHTEAGRRHLRDAWVLRRSKPMSERRQTAYALMRGVSRPNQLEALDKAYETMAAQRHQREQTILEAMHGLGWETHVPIAAKEAAHLIANSTGLTKDSVEKTMRQMHRNGMITIAFRHTTKPSRRGYTLSPEHREKALQNLAKAHAVPKPPATEERRRQVSEQSKQIQARLREEGPTERQKAYWERLRAQSRLRRPPSPASVPSRSGTTQPTLFEEQ